MAPLACECSFPFNLLKTLSFDFSDCMWSLDTDLGMHLTLWTDSKSYVPAHHSKCTVLVLLMFSCTVHGISFCSAPRLALMAIIWCLVAPFNLVEAYLTFPKVFILILRHATSLRLSLLPGPALIQADLDYQKTDVDQKTQQYVSACQGPSAKLDKDFIMCIEIGLSILLSVQIIQAFISIFRCDKCACIKGTFSYNHGFWNRCSHISHHRVGAKVAYVNFCTSWAICDGVWPSVKKEKSARSPGVSVTQC